MIIPMLPLRKLTEGHTASKWGSRDFNPDLSGSTLSRLFIMILLSLLLGVQMSIIL